MFYYIIGNFAKTKNENETFAFIHTHKKSKLLYFKPKIIK